MVTTFWVAGEDNRPIPHRRQVMMIGLYHTGGR